MAALAAAAGAVEMDNYLHHAMGINSAPLRGRLIQQGFNDDLERLATRNKEFVSKAASAIRKQGGAAAQAMSIGVEEDLAHLYKWAKHNDLVQRDLEFDRATLPNTLESCILVVSREKREANSSEI